MQLPVTGMGVRFKGTAWRATSEERVHDLRALESQG